MLGALRKNARAEMQPGTPSFPLLGPAIAWIWNSDWELLSKVLRSLEKIFQATDNQR